MEVLENGDYRLADGRVINRADVAGLHRTVPVDESMKKQTADRPPLKEGHSSGPMTLLG